MEQRMIGTFEVASGALMISDPSYPLKTWCQGTLENVLNGAWEAMVCTSDEGQFGVRVAALMVTHSDAKDGKGQVEHEASFEVGVDSGQAGIFDLKHYQDDAVITRTPEVSFGSPWYNACCEQTLDEPGGGVIPFGAVSSSGYGDGGYACTYYTDAAGRVVRVIIDYGLSTKRSLMKALLKRQKRRAQV